MGKWRGWDKLVERSPWHQWLKSHFPSPYQVYAFTLRFRDPELERGFSRSFELNPLLLGRLALFVGALAYALFGLMEDVWIGSQQPFLWWLRFGVGIPIIALAFGLTFLPGIRRYTDWILAIVIQLIGLSLIAMIFTTQAADTRPYESVFYLLGLVLLLIFNFVGFRMRVWVAALSGSVVIANFVLVGLFWGYEEPYFTSMGSMYLLTAMVPLLFGTTISEFFARKHFVDSLNLEHQARTDVLTGLANRRAFMERLQQEYARYQRYGTPFAVALLDADYFKQVNDRYGHDAGDAALKALGRIMSEHCRETDLLGRLGGEEFGLLMSQTEGRCARQACERLRAGVAEQRFHLPDGKEIAMTISLGMSVVRRDDGGIDAVLKRADTAMYAAKSSGRNRVRMD